MIFLTRIPTVKSRASARLILLVACLTGSASQAVAQEDARPHHLRDHVTIGAGTSIIPTFEGSDATRVLPVPVIDIRQGIFVANTYSGIGIDVPVTDGISLGAGTVFVLGYRRRDVPSGIDRVKNSAGVRANATFRTAGFLGTLGVTKALGGTKGVVADAVISYPIQLDGRFTLVPAVGTTWANAKHNDRYFGISAEEAARSGLPGFAAGSGFKNISFSLAANYRLSDRWRASIGASAIRLVGDVTDSPLVEKKVNGAGFATLSYTFGP